MRIQGAIRDSGSPIGDSENPISNFGSPNWDSGIPNGSQRVLLGTQRALPGTLIACGLCTNSVSKTVEINRINGINRFLEVSEAYWPKTC